MKKALLSNLKKDRQAFLFVILGIFLVLFSERISAYVPDMVGAALIAYAIINMYMELRYPESVISLGDAIVRAIVGIVLILEKEQAIAILGISWAVLSLNDVAEEIDEYHKTGEFRIIGAVSIIVTVISSALLMIDPFEHFEFHIRLIGLEMIAETFIKRRDISIHGRTERKR